MPGIAMDLEKPPIPEDPVKFTDLYEVNARLGQQINIMGIVVDIMPPRQTTGSDLQYTFTLHDSVSWIDDSNFSHSIGGLKVKFFRANITDFPRIQTIGDVVLLRHVKMTTFSGNPIAICPKGTSKWTVFPSRMIPTAETRQKANTNTPLAQWSSASTTQASKEEEAYAIWLRKWSLSNDFLRPAIDSAEASSLATEPSSPGSLMRSSRLASNNFASTPVVTTPVRNRFISLSEASDGRFCDVVVEVIKTFETGMGKEVYVTDYTENPKFFNYPYPDDKKDSSNGESYRDGDEFGYCGGAVSSTAHRNWPGPWGQFVMCVMLFPPHREATIKEHDIVQIRNLRCCYSKSGTHMEGKLHEDKQRPNQIDIFKIDTKHTSGPVEAKLTAFRERREEYWGKHGKTTATNLKGVAQNGGKSKPTNKEKAKAKREREKLKRKAQIAAAAANTLTDSIVRSNKHIRCSYPDKNVISLADIIDNPNRSYEASNGTDITLPFVNMICRAHVRAVDFFPPNIEDFARLVPVPRDPDGDEPMPSQSVRWQWAFYLLVEDARAHKSAESPERLKLLIADDVADFLLKLDATNLRENKSTFNRLKYRLSLLWGDLHEVKAKHSGPEALPRPSNVPFECCIQEYGVSNESARGQGQSWTAMHRIFQTTCDTDD